MALNSPTTPTGNSPDLGDLLANAFGIDWRVQTGRASVGRASATASASLDRAADDHQRFQNEVSLSYLEDAVTAFETTLRDDHFHALALKAGAPSSRDLPLLIEAIGGQIEDERERLAPVEDTSPVTLADVQAAYDAGNAPLGRKLAMRLA